MNSKSNNSTLRRSTIWNQNWLKQPHRSNYNRFIPIRWHSLFQTWELLRLEMRLQNQRSLISSLSFLKHKRKQMNTIRNIFRTLTRRTFQISSRLLTQNTITTSSQRGYNLLVTLQMMKITSFIKDQCRTFRQRLGKESLNQGSKNTDKLLSKLRIRWPTWGLTRFQ